MLLSILLLFYTHCGDLVVTDRQSRGFLQYADVKMFTFLVTSDAVNHMGVCVTVIVGFRHSVAKCKDQ